MLRVTAVDSPFQGYYFPTMDETLKFRMNNNILPNIGFSNQLPFFIAHFLKTAYPRNATLNAAANRTPLLLRGMKR